MIEHASKEIKDKAKKKKLDENNDMVNTQLALDGKPEKFPFKNIKPKKAFLLGGGDSTEEDQADGNVNLSSPEHQWILVIKVIGNDH